MRYSCSQLQSCCPISVDQASKAAERVDKRKMWKFQLTVVQSINWLEVWIELFHCYMIVFRPTESLNSDL
jgi:hypothetical protein